MLTLKEVRSMVSENYKGRVLTRKQLQEKEIVVKEKIDKDTEVSVYENGLVLYQSGARYSVFPLVDVIIEGNWIPDVLIFQYVFSDMYKHSNEEEIIQFIDKLAFFLNSCAENSIYIFCNDINLSTQYGGGREFFDILESKISEPKIVQRRYFRNMNKNSYYKYGIEYKKSELIFDDISAEIKN